MDSFINQHCFNPYVTNFVWWQPYAQFMPFYNHTMATTDIILLATLPVVLKSPWSLVSSTYYTRPTMICYSPSSFLTKTLLGSLLWLPSLTSNGTEPHETRHKVISIYNTFAVLMFLFITIGALSFYCGKTRRALFKARVRYQVVKLRFGVHLLLIKWGVPLSPAPEPPYPPPSWVAGILTPRARLSTSSGQGNLPTRASTSSKQGILTPRASTSSNHSTRTPRPSSSSMDDGLIRI